MVKSLLVNNMPLSVDWRVHAVARLPDYSSWQRWLYAVGFTNSLNRSPASLRQSEMPAVSHGTLPSKFDGKGGDLIVYINFKHVMSGTSC